MAQLPSSDHDNSIDVFSCLVRIESFSLPSAIVIYMHGSPCSENENTGDNELRRAPTWSTSLTLRQPVVCPE